ncbi:hypothetical protein F5Y09DRAFT_293609 [Xylaria sp. FL1042]|nr:hypothetical protein F5Y09DRAFT_293609 [Xylaria sp. FL1042]
MAAVSAVRATTSTKTSSGECPTDVRLGLVLSSVYISVFLMSLDRLIVTTAVPAITNGFDPLRDVGRYGDAYLLTSCAFQLLFGKLYSFYPIRLVFAFSVLLFEIGSALSGAAPGSVGLHHRKGHSWCRLRGHLHRRRLHV